jgi:CHAT domain/Lecithin:cholesterol acyltransferase
MVTRSKTAAKKSKPGSVAAAPVKATTVARPRRHPAREPAAPAAAAPAAGPPAPSGAPSAPITFALQGVIAEAPVSRGGPAAPATPALPAGLRHGRLMHSVRVQSQRSQGGGAITVQAEPGRDVVVLRLANGPELVLHPDHARALMLAQQDARPANRGLPGSGGGDATIEVPTQLRWRGLEAAASNAGATAARGSPLALLGDVMLSGFDVVRDAVVDNAAGLAAKALAARIDDQVVPGLYPLPDAGRLAKFKGSGVAALKALPAGDGPLLVFIHGTFSNSANAFGDLWSQHPQRIKALFDHYGRQRVYALDHPTLTQSPVANALALAQALPQGARVHLLTHSRGGLVAEVLARAASGAAALDDELKAIAADAAQDPSQGADALARLRDELNVLRAELAPLAELLQQRGVRIERVVRVACPARGTLLASGRLDAYLSVFKWTLSLSGVPVLPEIVDFLAAVAQNRTDVNTLPGLAAQIPGSALIQWLHAGVEPVAGELRVVAGDVKADSPIAWLKTLLADGFYWTDNDFVVQTSSMYGGAPRAGGASFLLDRGGDVMHTRYFHHARTAEGVCNALTQAEPEGFRPIGPLSWRGDDASGVRGRAGARSRARERARGGAPDGRAQSDLPAVILLPGILGSNIAVNGKRIWLGLRMIGGLSKLAWPDEQDRVGAPDGPIGLIYDDLADHLRATHQVIEFGFDWRRPIEDEAKRLAQVVREQLELRKSNNQPVRFVAHSMGGLVVRTMQIVEPDLWKLAMARDGARVLMLGTPNGGSWAPMQVLSGDDTFGNTLVAFGAPFGDHKARQLMARLPGFLQLQAALVDDQRKLELESTWQRLADEDLAAVRQFNWWHSGEAQLNTYRWGVPPQGVLDQAVALRRKLDAQRDKQLAGFADKLLLVVGKARFTPDGFEIGQRGLEYLDAQDDGDGRVTRPSARLPGVRTWEVDCEHGKLPDHEDAFAAYTELLADGTTSKLKLLADLGGASRGARDAAAPTQATASIAPHVRSRPARRPKALQPPSFEAEIGTLASSGLRDELPQRPGLPRIKVEVINANLMFTRQPLLVGHYRSTQLSGAEVVVDELLDGAMGVALKAGIYPERTGMHAVFRNASKGDNPLQMPRPEFAIVVGLGDESELKGNKLLDTVRRGFVAWARHQSARSGGAPAQLDIAATLIGSGGTGITPGQSAQMIARAADEANQVLADCGWPLIAGLSFVELYLDRASEAWRALQLLAAASDSRWEVGDEVQRGSGALRRSLDASYRGADYDLISAEIHGAGIAAQIAYTLDTRRARSEVRAQQTQPRLLREMVRRNSNARQQDANIGHTLYQLLVPVEMDAFFGGTTEMRLELVPGTAGIPWELLRHHGDNDENSQGPWAVRTKLLRKLRTTEFRAQVRDATREAGMLIIGEPATPPAPKDDPDKAFPRLAGARREAHMVKAYLDEQAQDGAPAVTALIANDDAASQPDAHRIIGELLAGEWRIVHIAGHGMPPEYAQPQSAADARTELDAPQRVIDPRGVVLSLGYLGPSEIRSMRTVPELVFVNCCHGADGDKAQLFTEQLSSRAEFASTVADELIKLGVRCVVAAGWAVEDGPACEFAREFYAALLAGERFLDASARARKAAWQASRNSNTWAAYQCYGDPDWRLTRSAARSSGRSLAERYAGVSSALALELALETVAIESSHIRGASGERHRKKQLERLVWLESRFGERWGQLGFVAHQFALAWKALDNDAHAIAWYEKAALAQDGSAPQTAVEQLANLRVRRAEAAVHQAAAALREARGRGEAGASDKAGKASSAADLAQKRKALQQAVDQARVEIDDALGDLDLLTQQHATIELHGLAGSAWKRLAMIANDLEREAEVQSAIAKMLGHYKQGLTMARKQAAPDLYYPGINLIAAQLAARTDGQPPPPLDAALVAEVRASYEAQVRKDPDFWSVVGGTELLLLEALAEEKLADKLAGVQREFADLQRRISTPSDWRSVFDTERFVLGRWAPHAVESEAKACRDVLRQLAGYAWPSAV